MKLATTIVVESNRHAKSLDGKAGEFGGIKTLISSTYSGETGMAMCMHRAGCVLRKHLRRACAFTSGWFSKTRSEGSTGSTGVFYHLSPNGTDFNNHPCMEYLFANPAVQQRSSSILLKQKSKKKVRIRCNKDAKDQLHSTCITTPLSNTA